MHRRSTHQKNSVCAQKDRRHNKFICLGALSLSRSEFRVLHCTVSVQFLSTSSFQEEMEVDNPRHPFYGDCFHRMGRIVHPSGSMGVQSSIPYWDFNPGTTSGGAIILLLYPLRMSFHLLFTVQFGKE